MNKDTENNLLDDHNAPVEEVIFVNGHKVIIRFSAKSTAVLHKIQKVLFGK